MCAVPDPPPLVERSFPLVVVFVVAEKGGNYVGIVNGLGYDDLPPFNSSDA